MSLRCVLLLLLAACQAPQPDVEVLASRARNAERQGRLGEAADAWMELSVISAQEGARAARGLARVLSMQGDDQAAARVLQNAHELHPKDPALALDLGLRLRASGNREEAAAMFQVALAEAPGWGAPHFAYADLLLERPGSEPDAIAQLEAGLALEPERRDMWLVLSSTQQTVGNPAATLAALRRADSLEPLHTGDAERAWRMYQTLPEEPVDVQGWLITLLDRVRQASPQADWAFAALGELYLNTGESTQALDCLRRAAELDPGNLSVLLLLGRLFKDQQDKDKLFSIVAHAHSLDLSEEDMQPFLELLGN